MTLEVLVIPTAGDIKDSCELILHTNVLSFRYIVDHWASRGFEALMPDCFYDEVFGEFGNGYLNSFALFTCKLVKTSKVEPPGWPEDAESDEFDEVWVYNALEIHIQSFPWMEMT